MKNKKLNIAVICADLDPNDLGGAEVHIVEVVRELASRGHSMLVFVGNDLNAASLFKSKNVQLHKVVYKRRRNFNSLAYISAAVKTIERMRDTKFDLLHAKQVFPQAIIGAKLKKKLGIPLYVTVQNPLAYKEELVLTGAGKIIFSPFLEVLGAMVKKSLRAADICGCVSEFSEQKSKEMGAKKTVRVPNGIDLEKFKLYKGDRKRFEIVTTSTLIPRNGIDVLIESLPEVVKTFPKTLLRIAGDGPMKSALVKRIKELGLGEHVEFLGTLPHSEVPELVKKAQSF